MLHLLQSLKRQCFSHQAFADAKGNENSPQMHVDEFLDIKKTQLKGVKAEAVTSRKKMVGTRADGSQMLCNIQGVDKHGDGLR